MLFHLTDLEKKILNPLDEKPMAQWAYIDSVFLILEHELESLEKIINKLNTFHTPLKSPAEYLRQKINFLDVNVIGKQELVTDLFAKPSHEPRTTYFVNEHSSLAK